MVAQDSCLFAEEGWLVTTYGLSTRHTAFVDEAFSSVYKSFFGTNGFYPNGPDGWKEHITMLIIGNPQHLVFEPVQKDEKQQLVLAMESRIDNCNKNSIFMLFFDRPIKFKVNVVKQRGGFTFDPGPTKKKLSTY